MNILVAYSKQMSNLLEKKSNALLVKSLGKHFIKTLPIKNSSLKLNFFLQIAYIYIYIEDPLIFIKIFYNLYIIAFIL